MNEARKSISVGDMVYTMEPVPGNEQRKHRVYYRVTGKYGRFFTAERCTRTGYLLKTSFLYSQIITGEVKRVA